MKIYVKNNNVVKAYKLLNKKLQGEGFYKELQSRSHFKSRGQRKREAHAAAVIREKRRQEKAEVAREKFEAKMRFANKKQKQQNKRYNKKST
jgi:ribosomal protein S21